MKKIIYSLVMLLVCLSACNKESITPPTETPVVISVSPKNPKPGDLVTITGTAFGTVIADVKVTIGTNAITITSVNGTEIKFTMPIGITEGDLNVIIKNINAKNADPQGVKITPQQTSVGIPTITSISPSSGKTGDLVTITGNNFSTIASENEVFFTVSTPTVTPAVVKSATATTLTVETPVGVSTGAISLKVKGATASAIVGTNLVFTVNGVVNTAESSTIFYIDGAKIYSTDLKGANQKLVIELNKTISTNPFISVSPVAVQKLLIFSDTDPIDGIISIKSVNYDGTNVKLVKKFAVGAKLTFLKAFNNGTIIYQVGGSTTWKLNFDGTNEIMLGDWYFNCWVTHQTMSADGTGLLNCDGYFMKIENNALSQTNRFQPFTTDEKNKLNDLRALGISQDAKKVVYLNATSTTTKEVKIKDILATMPPGDVIYTFEHPMTAWPDNMNVQFLNGGKSILLTYITTTYRSENLDYLNCQIIDIATKKVTDSWKITTPSIRKIIAD